MSEALYTFRRGETIRLALDAMSGDVSSVTAVHADLRRRKLPATALTGSETVAASFVVTPRAAVGDIPAGWDLTVPPSVSDTLPAGLYAADARLSFGPDDAETTEGWTVEIREAATRP